jgi:hypothetical protein
MVTTFSISVLTSLSLYSNFSANIFGDSDEEHPIRAKDNKTKKPTSIRFFLKISFPLKNKFKIHLFKNRNNEVTAVAAPAIKPTVSNVPDINPAITANTTAPPATICGIISPLS